MPLSITDTTNCDISLSFFRALIHNFSKNDLDHQAFVGVLDRVLNHVYENLLHSKFVDPHLRVLLKRVFEL
jgi:hypothetical protein